MFLKKRNLPPLKLRRDEFVPPRLRRDMEGISMADRQAPGNAKIHLLNGMMFWVEFVSGEEKLTFTMQFNGAIYVRPIDQAVMLCRIICERNGRILRENSITIRITRFTPSNYLSVKLPGKDRLPRRFAPRNDIMLRQVRQPRNDIKRQQQFLDMIRDLTETFTAIKNHIRKLREEMGKHNTIKRGKLSDD